MMEEQCPKEVHSVIFNIIHLDQSNSNNQEVSTTDKRNDKLQLYYHNGYTE